jgi:L-ascorbate metabolism protein UlaG (beta-lactamase superfamily)
MKITFLGHSTILLKTVEQKHILIDPFIDGNPTCPTEFKNNLPKIDLLILTHGHSDHTADVFTIIEKDKPKLIATYELGSLVSTYSSTPINYEPMNKGGTVRIEDFKMNITLTHASHSSSFTAPDGSTHYAGEPCGVIMNFDDGPCIYNAGDTCYFEEMKLIRNIYRPDIALLPIGDRFTMGPKEAGIAAQALGVKKVIPIHWGTFPLLTGTPEELQKNCEYREIEVITLNPGESYDFQADT